jgi:prepilin-type processing-associated H-X9-DG protein
MDGAQLSRPPAYFKVNNSAVNIAVWGSHQRGTGVIAPAGGPSTATNAAIVNAHLTGRLTNVVFADGHAKTKKTMEFCGVNQVMENGAWRGTLLNDSTPAGNAGWAHDW